MHMKLTMIGIARNNKTKPIRLNFFILNFFIFNSSFFTVNDECKIFARKLCDVSEKSSRRQAQPRKNYAVRSTIFFGGWDCRKVAFYKFSNSAFVFLFSVLPGILVELTPVLPGFYAYAQRHVQFYYVFHFFLQKGFYGFFFFSRAFQNKLVVNLQNHFSTFVTFV